MADVPSLLNSGTISVMGGAAPSVFGEIDGYPVGSLFPDREALRLAGPHRHVRNGISGNPEQGADAIVVSGGYVDDEDDGTSILYTGQGGRDERGRQIRDQTLTSGILGLVNSELSGRPVRVIRGAGGDPEHSPSSGYRYDGLFVVVSHFKQPSIDGPLVYRFRLERSEEADGSAWINPAVSIGSPPAGNAQPKSVATTVQRIVRNTRITDWVKNAYDHTCQFCDTRIETPTGPYAEGAHIRPLGRDHFGADIPENVLCLCANCHVRFDKGAIYIEDGDVVDLHTGARTPLEIAEWHKIDPNSTLYHREHIVPAGDN